MHFFKKWLSFFFEIPIEKAKSSYSGNIEIVYHKGNYKLETYNTIYSFGNYYTSFKKVFDKYNIENINCSEVLILGIGLGSIVNLLEHNKSIKNITAVDIDKTIICLCRKYLKTTHSINYINEDAFNFVVNNQNKYQLILVDLFINEVTPKPFLSLDFLKALKKSINNTNSYIIFSKLEWNKSHQKENAYFEQNFKQVFKSYQKYRTEGNLLFIVN